MSGENHKLEQSTISYMICATPRSGSTLLCEALKNSGLAGNPDEYFGPMHVKRWDEAWKTKSKLEYLGKVLEQGRGENNVFGIKVMRVYWQNLIVFLQEATKLAKYQENELLKQCFPNLRYIWITRRDKVRQAISWMKFLQGSAWYWEDEKPQKFEDLVFKPDVIREFIVQTASHETMWQEYFRNNDIQPYIVVYEDLVNSYEETAKGILRYLGISYPERLIFDQRRIKKQADEITDLWVERYLSIYKDTEKISV